MNPGKSTGTLSGARSLGMIVLSLLFLCSCASEKVRNPVPPSLRDTAEVAGTRGLRVWGDGHDNALNGDFVQSIRDEPAGSFPRGPNGEIQYSGLALSGGGEHGAFGAGFLEGWSASGTRPKFKVVTGISTGALIAPFALLGPEYDETLKEAYTNTTVDKVLAKKWLAGAYWRESLFDNHPLEKMVREAMSDGVIDAIGKAHRNGQRLFVSTTNFDAQRPVIWNMGAVANSQHPDAYALFRKIIVASTAIPAVFIDVNADGKRYSEMHVDGGTLGQMFFYGSSMDWQAALRDANGGTQPDDQSVLYIIVDGQIAPDYETVRRRLLPITNRTIQTLVKVSAWSALYRMYLHAQIGGYGLKYTALPEDYQPESDEPYDPTEMRRMFELGQTMGNNGDSWRSTPPGL